MALGSAYLWWVRGPYRRFYGARPTRPGITVVTVNYNSLEMLRTQAAALRKYASSVDVLVVDNASADGSVQWLKATNTPHVALRANVGHPTGLDIGFAIARTEYLIALDIDAFPIDDRFLEKLISPLRQGARVVGARSRRRGELVHPSCLAMRRDDFAGLTFAAERGQDGSMVADTGDRISLHYAPDVVPIDATSRVGPGPLGSVFGEVVYHNYYGTRFGRTDGDLIDGVIERSAAERAWESAVIRYGVAPD